MQITDIANKFHITQVIQLPYALFIPIIICFAIMLMAFFYVPTYNTPENMPLWIFFIGLPHIISSFQTMCVREYIIERKMFVIIFFCLFFAPFLAYYLGIKHQWIITVYVSLMIYHLINQQFGIAYSILKAKQSNLLIICKWLIIILAIMGFYKSYYYYSSSLLFFNYSLIPLLNFINNHIIVIFNLLMMTSGILCWEVRDNKVGCLFLTANFVICLCSLFFVYQTSLGIIGLICINLLHDLTAYTVYMHYDHKRNKPKIENYLYKIASIIPTWLLNPILSIAIAGMLTYLASGHPFIYYLILGIAISHYLMEGFIWKGDRPHRQYVKFN